MGRLRLPWCAPRHLFASREFRHAFGNARAPATRSAPSHSAPPPAPRVCSRAGASGWVSCRLGGHSGARWRRCRGGLSPGTGGTAAPPAIGRRPRRRPPRYSGPCHCCGRRRGCTTRGAQPAAVLLRWWPHQAAAEPAPPTPPVSPGGDHTVTAVGCSWHLHLAGQRPSSRQHARLVWSELSVLLWTDLALPSLPMTSDLPLSPLLPPSPCCRPPSPPNPWVR